MAYELFEIDRKETLNEEELGRVEHLCAKLSSAKSLGLVAQAESISSDIATVERAGLIITPPMTDAELIIWSTWLPVIYSDNSEEKLHELADYSLDSIPSPVLRQWDTHKESGLFERFEVWAPLTTQRDRILVGVNGNARHLLARWSVAELLPFKDIKKKLAYRWEKEFYTKNSFLFFLVACTAITEIFIGGLLVLGLFDYPRDATPSAAIIASFLLGAVFMLCFYSCYRRKPVKESELKQAIAKDDSRPREILAT